MIDTQNCKNHDQVFCKTFNAYQCITIKYMDPNLYSVVSFHDDTLKSAENVRFFGITELLRVPPINFLLLFEQLRKLSVVGSWGS